MKTQFMILWDGLTTSQNQKNRILIIGATNRPEDVDPAILRRMPQMFYIGLPDRLQRKKILTVILRDENLSADVDLDDIAEKTNNFSGSDLHELCRSAAMNSFIETLKKVQSNNDHENESSERLPTDENALINAAVIRNVDFNVAFKKVLVKTLAKNPLLNMRES
jgi:SpoVK/Ycf46/Vps4 family AAA+-type ATPase